MPPSSTVVRLQVTVNKNGHRKQVLEDVRSVLEVSDEENETIKRLSFYNIGKKASNEHYSPGTWHDFGPEDFDRITIEKRRPND